MEIEEISSKENPFLKRKEIMLKVAGEGATPKKNELLDKICSQYNLKDKNLVVIETIKTVFGKRDCEAFIKVYESEDVLKSIEPQPKKTVEKQPSNVPDDSGQIKVDTGGGDAEPKAGEKPAEEKKDESAKEEEKKE